MSRNVKSTQPKTINNKSTMMNNKKPYCKVCFDAGKPESEYTSHWVRSIPDRSGKTTVTCPTLLTIECNYCSCLGHTVKFCPSLKQNKEQTIQKPKTEVAEKKVRENKSERAFAALMDSDSEEDTPVKRVDFPVLCRVVKHEKPSESTKTNWASIAAKPAQMSNESGNRNNFVTLSDFMKPELTKIEPKREKKVISKGKPAPWAIEKVVVTRSWAELSDSEDEDEDEDEDDVYEKHWSRWGETDSEDDPQGW